MAYKLSAVLEGHTADVRGIAAQGSDMLVTVSRDGTGRIWRHNADNTWAAAGVLAGHDGYVTSVAVLGSGQIATGGMDGTICVWDARDVGAPVRRLRGHSGNVCALAAAGDVLVSGSWDRTARVWVGGECTHTLAGHAQAVWGVLVLDGDVVTASADRLVRRWRGGRLQHTYEGHTDCVRALAPARGGFASAANDGTVRVWDADSGACVRELRGHTSLVYALASGGSCDSSGGEWLVSGGEDRAMRVWDESGLRHTVLVPSTSVWAVAALANGDIACGTDDGRVRVFTRDASRVDASACARLAEQNADFAMSAKAMGVDAARLAGPERLERPGDADEQVVVVRDGSQVTAHQWSRERGAWARVGSVVSSAGSAQKQTFGGREYDYVFDVDIREGAPPLKLPFNASENPFAAAQRFLERNGLPMEHLDTVADFIVKNADGVQLGPSQTYADPFTGGNRYVPGQATAQGSSAPDPFAGSRYTPAAAAGYAPPTEFVINGQGNGSAIVRKLAAFNAELAGDSSTAHVAASADAMQRISELAALGSASPNEVSEPAFSALLDVVRTWPRDRRFPALDLLRLALASPPPFAFHARGGKDLVACIAEACDLYALFADEGRVLAKSDEVTLMMAVRALANAFSAAEGAALVWDARRQVLDALDGAWARVANASLVTALSSLYLNLAIASARRGDDDEGLNILSAASRFLAQTENPDAQLRLVNVFGVLAARFQLCKDSARVLGDETIVILGIQGKTDAVKQAARDV
ncbi:hypothetical protein GGF43_005172, partial [Coemansia sp. RSA 2618]